MTGRTAPVPRDLVEDYLDRLLVALRGSPRQVRHIMAEVEEHLRDAVAEGMAGGLPEARAQARAVARMGPVTAVAGRGSLLSRPSRGLARRLVLTLTLVGSAGLTAIGGAGLAAVALAALEMVQHGVGAGQPLSLGLAAAVTAVLFGVSLARHFSERA